MRDNPKRRARKQLRAWTGNLFSECVRMLGKRYFVALSLFVKLDKASVAYISSRLRWASCPFYIHFRDGDKYLVPFGGFRSQLFRCGFRLEQ